MTKPFRPLPKGEASTPINFSTAWSIALIITAANKTAQNPVIENPGVKNAVILKTIIDTISLIMYPRYHEYYFLYYFHPFLYLQFKDINIFILYIILKNIIKI